LNVVKSVALCLFFYLFMLRVFAELPYITLKIYIAEKTVDLIML